MLIERLERATAGSRELDEEIAAFIAGATIERQSDGRLAAYRGGSWVSIEPVRQFSSSLDAALTLVPEGAQWSLEADTAWVRVLKADDVGEFQGGFNQRDGKCTALALCIAALRARP